MNKLNINPGSYQRLGFSRYTVVAVEVQFIHGSTVLLLCEV